MHTLTKSCSRTIVKTANGEVQTHEEATVYVKELGISLTMKVLENTPAVLSLGKLCDEKKVFLRMDQWSKTTSHLKRDSDNFQYGELRSHCGTRFVKFIFLIVIDLKDTFETGESFFVIFFILIFFTYSKVKFRFEKGKMGINLTSLQCKCLIRLMIDQGNLMKPRSNGATL